MNSRKLIIVAVPAAAVLILALLRVLGDGDSVADPGDGAVVVSGEHDPNAPSFSPSVLLPLAGEGQAVPLGGDERTGEGDGDPDASLLGRVSGRLVDQADRPVPGEPVFLLRDRDNWADPADKRPDTSAKERVTAKGVSGPDGRFELPARAGRRHELYAGGAKWAMETLDRVTSGDDVRVVMRDGLVLTGQVYEAETSMPVGGAQVLVLAEDNVVLGTTLADGTFSIGPMPSEIAIVGAWAPGYDADTHYNIAPALGPVSLELGSGREVSGVLVDDETGEPLTGGTLRSVMDVEARIFGDEVDLPENQLVDEREVEVGEDGSFVLPGMPSRGFTLIAESPGYVPYHYTRYESRELDEGRTITLKLKVLLPMQVLVEDATTDEVVPGARVAAFGGQGVLDSAVADEDGAVELALDEWDGRDPLWVEAIDAPDRTARMFVKPKEYAGGVKLSLLPAFRIGALVVQDGQPVVGAEVALLGDDERITVGRTGMDGMVELRHEPGDGDLDGLHLQARYLDMQSLPVEIDGEDLPVTPVTLDLLDGGWLAGRVVDPFGIPVPSARLVVTEDGKKSGDLRELTTHSREDGSFRIGPLRVDVAQNLEVRADGFDRRTLHDLLPGDDEMLIHLDPVVEWEGRVVAATTSQPLTSYSLRLLQYKDGSKPGFKSTKARVTRKLDEPGGFSVSLPGPGRYQLQLSVSGHMTAYSEEVVFNGIQPPPFATMMIWPAAVLEVTVNDTIGRPVHGYSVAVIPWDAASGADRPDGKVRKKGRTSRTNSQGKATFNLGEGGGYRVAGGPGVWFENMMLAVTPGPPVKRLYHLPATGDVEVTVVDEHGAPLSDGRVYVRTHKNEKQHSIYRRHSLRRGDHVAFFETLPQATYEIEVRRRNYTTLKQEVSVRGHGIERVTIAMQPRDSGSSSGSGQVSVRKVR
jgi:hypothetical protein